MKFVASVAAVKAGIGADDDEAAGFRSQALAWLQEEVESMKKDLSENHTLQNRIRIELAKWQNHVVLFRVRDPKALDNLPLAERQKWQEFWLEVEKVRRAPNIAPPPHVPHQE
jgi:hypothetical protein